MPIERGDTLIMSQQGVEQIVEAMSGVADGLVQIKNKGTYSPCPVQRLHEPYILTDPNGKGLETGGPIYVQPDGQTTEDLKKVKMFKTPEEAEEFRDDHSGIPYFVPKKFKDC